MINILLTLKVRERRTFLKSLPLETRIQIFKDIPKLTDILKLDQVKDFNKDVILRVE